MDAVTRTYALPADLRDRAGQLILTGFRGLTPFDAEVTFRQIREGRIGGVLLFDREENTGLARNVASREQVRALTAALHAAPAEIPLLICSDEEGGRYHRLRAQYGFPETQPARYLGQLNDPAKTHEAAAVIASAMVDAGVDLNLAPVVDVHVPTNLGVGFFGRAFSDDPEAVAVHAGEFVRAHHELGVLTALKHFPGSGTVVFDPVTVTETAASWSPAELVPFLEILPNTSVDMIMITRARVPALDPDLPAVLSRKIVTDLLRGELGFDGVVLSDAIEISSIWEVYGFDRAIALALNAGVDMLMFCNVPLGGVPYEDDRASRAVEAIVAAVERGDVPESRVNEACERVLKLKARMLPSALPPARKD